LQTDSSGNVSIWIESGNSFNLDTVEITAGSAAPVDVTFRPIGDYAGFYGYFEGDLEEFDSGNTSLYGKLHANAGCWLGGLSSYADISAQTGIYNTYLPADPRSHSRSPEPPALYSLIPPARSDLLVASWVGQPTFKSTDANPNNDGPRELIETPSPFYPDPFQAVRLANLASVAIVLDSSQPVGSQAWLQVFLGPGFSQSQAPLALRSAILAAMAGQTSLGGELLDDREAGTVLVTNFDVQALLQAMTNSTAFAQTGGFNGIIFIEDVSGLTSGSPKKAIRFFNGAAIPNLANSANPNGGLSLISPNGVYLKGDFNCGSSPYSNSSAGNLNPPTSADVLANNGSGDTAFQSFPVAAGYVRKPVMIACDAFTALSNSWSDANSTASLSSRVASSTTMNLLVLTGNVPTTSSSYSGGLTGTIRLAESWTDETLTFYGALVVPFASVSFVGHWSAASYNPPVRNWYYDPLFQTAAPPGLPLVQLNPVP
jgi:hypothetical protein